jgi:hypothetical protein
VAHAAFTFVLLLGAGPLLPGAGLAVGALGAALLRSSLESQLSGIGRATRAVLAE